MTPRTVQVIAAVALTGLIACAIGPRPQDARMVRTGEGAYITVIAGRALRNAELLEVSDSAFLVLTTNLQIVRVHYAAVRRVSVEGTRVVALRGAPTPQEIAAWRRMARYPQTLTPAQLDTLLRHYNRTEVEVVR